MPLATTEVRRKRDGGPSSGSSGKGLLFSEHGFLICKTGLTSPKETAFTKDLAQDLP